MMVEHEEHRRHQSGAAHHHWGPEKLRVELEVHELGLPVSPLPMRVRKRWLDWVTGATASPRSRSPSRLKLVEQRLNDAAERRKEQQARIIQQARSRPRKLARAASNCARRSAQFQALEDKLANAEKRRERHLNSKRQPPFLQRLGVESRRRALLRRRQQAAMLLQESWKSFQHKHKTTRQLAQDFLATDVMELVSPEGLQPDIIPGNETSEGPSPFRRRVRTFEGAAGCIQSPKTIRALKALLDRLVSRRAMRGDNGSDNLTAPLLRRLYPKLPAGATVPHYHPRVILSSVMICEHPDVVFNSDGAVEQQLSASASEMLKKMRSLLDHITLQAANPGWGSRFFYLLKMWDESWIDYLSAFVSWKVQDAEALEQELIDIATKMEKSRLEKCGPDASASRVLNSSDLQGIVQQVEFDQQLLRDRIRKLTGPAGVKRMEDALVNTRCDFEAEQGSLEEKGTDIDALLECGGADVVSAGKTDLNDTTSGAGGGRSPTWAVARDSMGGMSNEAMVHEMLYNPGWQLSDSELLETWVTAKTACSTDEPLKCLPQLDMQELQMQGPEGAAATMRKHMAVVAEQAFWDSVEAGLNSSGSDESGPATMGGGASPRRGNEPAVAERVATLLAELAQEVLKVLPEQGPGQALAELAATFSVSELLKTLHSSGGSGGQPIAALLHQMAAMMARLGSPARSEEAAAAHAMVEAQFEAAEGGQEGAPSVARVTARALRLLFCQMKLLKLDAANARLRMLSAAIAGGQALQYCSTKFSQRHGLPSEPPPMPSEAVADKLPNVAKWLPDTIAAAARTHAALQAAGLDDSAVQTAIAAIQASAPEGLRAGRTPIATSPDGPSRASGVPRLAPVSATAWQGQVRVGLVGLITSEAPAVGPDLPETLELDARRLHRCQNELQRILVLSACLLLHQQAAGEAGAPLEQSEASAVKARLSGLLLEGSPSLGDLASELARAGGEAITEEGLHAGLQRMLTPGSGALQALRAGLGSALCLLLLFPRGCGGAPVEAELSRALGRCGGAPMTEDVKALASELAEVAAVTEAVHAAVYRCLLTHHP